MHTVRTIVLIVATVALGGLAVAGALVAVLGPWPGLAVALGLAAVLLAHYGLVLRPWHRRWGATDAEVHAPLPGDDLLPGASATTRAIAVAARPADVWPWLVQIGWGRAGWYSYDWIDNDGQPSATTIVPEWQGLAEGDRIAMTPDAGFVVVHLDPPQVLVALSDDGSTSWCLQVTPHGSGSRLVSRFRNRSHLTPAAALWLLVADPGVFIMEHKMLQGIAARAGSLASAREAGHDPRGPAAPAPLPLPLVGGAGTAPEAQPTAG